MKLLQLQHQDAPRTQNSESRAQNPELRTRAAMFKVAHAAAARPRKTIKTHNLAGGNRMGESGILGQFSSRMEMVLGMEMEDWKCRGGQSTSVAT